MSDTSIEWTDKSWNPLAAYYNGKRGWMCSKPSLGCKNCYSERLNLRLGNGLRYTPEGVAKVDWRLVNMSEPGKWRKPQRIFVESMGDLFHEALPDGLIWEIWNAMLWYPQHTFQVLTKRAERMRELVVRFKAEGERQGMQSADHIWLGVSVENQEMADKRIPELMKIPAKVRFLSCEPMLGPVDLTALGASVPTNYPFLDCLRGKESPGPYLHDAKIHWVICGGESGNGARAFDPEWARSIKTQCEEAGINFFMKQLGAKPLGIDVLSKKGNFLEEMPADLRVRQLPIE